MIVSDLAVAVAVIAFVITQVHLVRVARKLIRKSKESWAKAEETIAASKDEIQASVNETLKPIMSKLDNQSMALPETVNSLKVQVETIPQSLADVMQIQMEEHTKTLGNHFSQQLTDGIQAVQKQIGEVEAKVTNARRFGGDPSGSQTKSVESRRCNQVVEALDRHTGGGSDLMAKARMVSGFLEDVGETDLADWLDANPDSIPNIERRIRSMPSLAKRLNELQARFDKAVAGQPNGGVMPSNASMEM